MSFQRQIGLDLYPQQFFAAMLALTLALAFLTLPFRSGTDRNKGALVRCGTGFDQLDCRWIYCSALS